MKHDLLVSIVASGPVENLEDRIAGLILRAEQRRRNKNPLPGCNLTRELAKTFNYRDFITGKGACQNVVRTERGTY